MSRAWNLRSDIDVAAPLKDNAYMNQNDNVPLIDVGSVVKRFGRVTAVDNVSFRVNSGEALSLFGPNGAGKTTLLRMIAGLVKPTAGSITIDGYPLDTHHDSVRGAIGYISHQSLTYDQLSARENLMFFANLYGVANRDDVVDGLLNEVGLYSRADDVVRTFSRGMKQRLSIARAIVHGPKIVLLDEPFTGLDQHAAEMLRRTLARLSGEKRTIVMITHNLTVGIAMSTRVAVQVAGKIMLDKATKDIDKDEFREMYFNTVGEAHY